ncbi:MAG: hypothetical protein CMB80_11060 [Flammeovirgaceae bacterium]|nr:hypothetical protein [Flammeovirgaceae bacterium]MBE61259.1 hypothetical protein [Flammeovirgaceae bacterium]MBR11164.1 hypothetical protein [Rickettsiales bacterium]|tara:strand:- start:8195 stop:9868 length:1674 start_codon:yes stop_codon:yes gene_type:complete
MRCILSILLAILVLSGIAQVTPPCGNDYGTDSNESNIIQQMRYGEIADAINAIDQAKNSRGTALGCPQIALSYSDPEFSRPSLSEIETIWNEILAPNISSITINCPRIGRYENNVALGAYYAMQGGYFNDRSTLAEIANMMYDQQYADWNVGSPEPRNEGVYAYISTTSSNPCYPGGVVGSSVAEVCTNLPNYCVEYVNGQFTGNQFLTSAQDDASNWFDGGLAYDHGWVGVQMIESAINQSDPSLKLKFRNSALLAGKFAISEFSVKNHNYTSKLIWLLSELYAWTGEEQYKNELNYKLNKSLIPGILWDENLDGFVDGTSPTIAFTSLTNIAQTPGRMWDGHNAISWYHAMNTWALTEAYVAFRDRGDLARANELKPYLLAMLDNLSKEIIDLGVVTPDALGVRDITYALLIGIWKVALYENESHENWEKAAWAMWNSGYFESYSTHSVCVGLFLCVLSETPYVPLNERELRTLSTEDQKQIEIYPNPVGTTLNVHLPGTSNHHYSLVDLTGRQHLSGTLKGSSTVDISMLPKGQYLIQWSANGAIIESTKIIVR